MCCFCIALQSAAVHQASGCIFEAVIFYFASATSSNWALLDLARSGKSATHGRLLKRWAGSKKNATYSFILFTFISWIKIQKVEARITNRCLKGQLVWMDPVQKRLLFIEMLQTNFPGSWACTLNSIIGSFCLDFLSISVLWRPEKTPLQIKVMHPEYWWTLECDCLSQNNQQFCGKFLMCLCIYIKRLHHFTNKLRKRVKNSLDKSTT